MHRIVRGKGERFSDEVPRFKSSSVHKVPSFPQSSLSSTSTTSIKQNVRYEGEAFLCDPLSTLPLETDQEVKRKVEFHNNTPAIMSLILAGGIIGVIFELGREIAIRIDQCASNNQTAMKMKDRVKRVSDFIKVKYADGRFITPSVEVSLASLLQEFKAIQGTLKWWEDLGSVMRFFNCKDFALALEKSHEAISQLEMELSLTSQDAIAQRVDDRFQRLEAMLVDMNAAMAHAQNEKSRANAECQGKLKQNEDLLKLLEQLVQQKPSASASTTASQPAPGATASAPRRDPMEQLWESPVAAINPYEIKTNAEDDLGLAGSGFSIKPAKWGGLDVALKVCQGFDANQIRELRKEVAHTAPWRHPNIITIYGYCEDREQGYAAIVMELFPRNNSLFDRLMASGQWRSEGQVGPNPALPWMIRVELALQLASAVAYLHSRGTCHCDLKSLNAMLTADGMTIKLIDFGLAKSAATLARGTQAAKVHSYTLNWTPKEMLREGFIPTPAEDVYSLGAMLSELITGHPPFAGWAPADVQAAIQNGVLPDLTPEVDLPGLVSPSAKSLALFTDVVKKCMHPDRSVRMSAAEAAAILPAIVAEAWGEFADSISADPSRALQYRGLTLDRQYCLDRKSVHCLRSPEGCIELARALPDQLSTVTVNGQKYSKLELLLHAQRLAGGRHAKAWVWLGLLCCPEYPTVPYGENEDLDAAECYRRALECGLDEEGSDDEVARFRVWYHLGIALAETSGRTVTVNGEQVGEEACYRKALELRPTFGEAWNNLGCALEVRSRQPGANGAPATAAINGTTYTAKQCYTKAVECPSLDGTEGNAAWANLLDAMGDNETVQLAFSKARCRSELRPSPQVGAGGANAVTPNVGSASHQECQDALQRRENEFAEERAKLVLELENLKASNLTYRKQVEDLTVRNDSLQTDLESSKREVDRLNEKVLRLEADRDELRPILSVKETELEQCNSKVKFFNQQIQDLTKEKDSLTKEVKDLEHRLSQKVVELDAAKKAQESSNAKEATETLEKTALLADLTSTQNSLKTLQTEHDALKKEHEACLTFKGERVSIEQQKATLQGEVDSLQGEVISRRGMLKDLADREREVRAELDSLGTVVELARKDHTNVTNELASLELILKERQEVLQTTMSILQANESLSQKQQQELERQKATAAHLAEENRLRQEKAVAARKAREEAAAKQAAEEKAKREREARAHQIPLIAAAQYGLMDLVQELVENAKANVNEIYGEGYTPLIMAAISGRDQVCDYLCRHGARLEDRDGVDGRTPLSWAAYNGHTKTCEVLLRHQAAIEARDKNGFTPLLLAAARARAEVCTLLITNGADRRAVTGDRRTALHLVAKSSASRQETVQTLEQFLPALDVNARDGHGWTPLMSAAIFDADDCAAELLHRWKADPTLKDDHGKTALDLAVDNKCPKCEALLRGKK